MQEVARNYLKILDHPNVILFLNDIKNKCSSEIVIIKNTIDNGEWPEEYLGSSGGDANSNYQQDVYGPNKELSNINDRLKSITKEFNEIEAIIKYLKR